MPEFCRKSPAWTETGAPICPRRERRRERPQQPPPRSPVSTYVSTYARTYVSIFPWSRFPSSRDSRPPAHTLQAFAVYVRTCIRTYVRMYVRVGVVVYVSTHVRTQERIIQWCGRAGGGGQAAQDPPGSSSGLLIRPARPHPPQARTDPIDPFKARARTPRLGPATGTPTHPKAWA